MSMSDPVADMLTRIRNANAAKLDTVQIPTSKLKAAVANVLKEQGYIQDCRVDNPGTPDAVLVLELKYKGKHIDPVIEGIERVSKPSRRVYADHANLPRVLGGLGVAIVSTSSGVMTARQARKQNIGGEVLCYVW